MLLKAKLAKGGKISIPSICRRHLNIKEGEEIVFHIQENGEVVISPLKLNLERARKLVRKYILPEISLVDELIAERRREAENE